MGLWAVKCLLISQLQTNPISDDDTLIIVLLYVHGSFGREGFMIFTKEKATVGKSKV